MDEALKWYKKTAVSKAWHAYVQATDEADVHAMHDQEAAIFPHLAAQYPGAYQIEELPADFVPPAPLDALQRGDFATFEEQLWTGKLDKEEK